jgi:hypothetical protein
MSLFNKKSGKAPEPDAPAEPAIELQTFPKVDLAARKEVLEKKCARLRSDLDRNEGITGRILGDFKFHLDMPALRESALDSVARGQMGDEGVELDSLRQLFP